MWVLERQARALDLRVAAWTRYTFRKRTRRQRKVRKSDPLLQTGGMKGAPKRERVWRICAVGMSCTYWNNTALEQKGCSRWWFPYCHHMLASWYMWNLEIFRFSTFFSRRWNRTSSRNGRRWIYYWFWGLVVLTARKYQVGSVWRLKCYGCDVGRFQMRRRLRQCGGWPEWVPPTVTGRRIWLWQGCCYQSV